jgi:single-strand DNA-binding protein
MNLSPTTVVGNITADPELVYLPSGAAKCSFSVAVNHIWYDENKEKQEKTSFVNVISWRYLAENFARVAEKGIGVIVQGRLEQRSWEDKESGQKRSTTEIVAEEIGILARSIESLERRRAQGNTTTDASEQKSSGAPASRQQRRTVSVGAPKEEEPF